jgi:hypothetical protein
LRQKSTKHDNSQEKKKEKKKFTEKPRQTLRSFPQVQPCCRSHACLDRKIKRQKKTKAQAETATDQG